MVAQGNGGQTLFSLTIQLTVFEARKDMYATEKGDTGSISQSGLDTANILMSTHIDNILCS